MSHIFDALQRSEAERSGVDPSSVLVATDLLARAEQQVSSLWEAPPADEREQGGESLERAMAFTATPGGHVAEAVVSPVEADPAPALQPEIFSQFRTLDLSITVPNRLAVLAEGENPAAEAFRLLGVRLRHIKRDRGLKRLLITSTIPQEGKSVVSANLACTLGSGTQQKVLLLEGDVRRPSLSKVFGLGVHPGLCEWLQGKSKISESLYHMKEPGIWILPAGEAPANPLDLLQSRKLAKLLDQLTAWFDWIVIDSPPVLPLADTSVWARLAEGILLVTRQGTTEKRHLQRGLEALEPKKLIGAVLNSSNNSANDSYYYYRRPAESPAAD